jgi:hypothetical protein
VGRGVHTQSSALHRAKNRRYHTEQFHAGAETIDDIPHHEPHLDRRTKTKIEQPCAQYTDSITIRFLRIRLQGHTMMWQLRDLRGISELHTKRCLQPSSNTENIELPFARPSIATNLAFETFAWFHLVRFQTSMPSTCSAICMFRLVDPL